MSIKESIITKIQSSSDEQLLSEISRILETENFIFSSDKIQQLNEADASIEKGDFSKQEDVETKMKEWLKKSKYLVTASSIKFTGNTYLLDKE